MTLQTSTPSPTTQALLAELVERAVMVLGDLNDEPQAATTQILLGPPRSKIGTAAMC